MRARRAWILSLGVVAAVLLPASATAVPGAGKSALNENLVSYTGPNGKIKIAKRMSYFLACTTGCAVTVSSTLVVPGPNPAPLVSQKTFPTATNIEAFVIVKSKAGRRFLKDNVGKSKIASKVSAVDINTGDTDTDKRTFKLKL